MICTKRTPRSTKRRAINTLGYGTNAKLMVGFAERRWRDILARVPVEQVSDRRLDLVAHYRTMQVADVAQPVDLDQHAGELVLVALRPGELDLEQVQDLGVGEDPAVRAVG